jgi:hypothetical protein
MHYAIQSETIHFTHLESTGRKRAIKNSIIHVDHGIMLFRLGKQEYAIERDQAIWVPAECLSSITYLPNTDITRIDFSVRLDQPFPNQAGIISLNGLTKAIIERLRHVERDHEVYCHLTHILKDEALRFKPQTTLSKLSEQITNWTPDTDIASPTDLAPLTKEIQLALTVREALKCHLSGVKSAQIIATLFHGNQQQFEQLCLILLGRQLF